MASQGGQGGWVWKPSASMAALANQQVTVVGSDIGNARSAHQPWAGATPPLQSDTEPEFRFPSRTERPLRTDMMAQLFGTGSSEPPHTSTSGQELRRAELEEQMFKFHAAYWQRHEPPVMPNTAVLLAPTKKTSNTVFAEIEAVRMETQSFDGVEVEMGKSIFGDIPSPPRGASPLLLDIESTCVDTLDSEWVPMQPESVASQVEIAPPQPAIHTQEVAYMVADTPQDVEHSAQDLLSDDTRDKYINSLREMIDKRELRTFATTDLREICGTLGLAQIGSRIELQSRIVDHVLAYHKTFMTSATK